MTVLTVLYCILYCQINVALVSLRDIFMKTVKKNTILTPTFLNGFVYIKCIDIRTKYSFDLFVCKRDRAQCRKIGINTRENVSDSCFKYLINIYKIM